MATISHANKARLSEEGRDKDPGIANDLPAEFEGFEQRQKEKKEDSQCFHAPR